MTWILQNMTGHELYGVSQFLRQLQLTTEQLQIAIGIFNKTDQYRAAISSEEAPGVTGPRPTVAATEGSRTNTGWIYSADQWMPYTTYKASGNLKPGDQFQGYTWTGQGWTTPDEGITNALGWIFGGFLAYQFIK